MCMPFRHAPNSNNVVRSLLRTGVFCQSTPDYELDRNVDQQSLCSEFSIASNISTHAKVAQLMIIRTEQLTVDSLIIMIIS